MKENLLKKPRTVQAAHRSPTNPVSSKMFVLEDAKKLKKAVHRPTQSSGTVRVKVERQGKNLVEETVKYNITDYKTCCQTCKESQSIVFNKYKRTLHDLDCEQQDQDSYPQMPRLSEA